MKISIAKNRILHFAAVILISNCTLFAQNTLLNRQTVLENAKEVTLKAYPNADEVQVDDYTRVEYQTDGTDIELNDSYIKILTEKGKRSNQNLTFHFTLPYDELAVQLVEIIKPDGTSTQIDIETQSSVMVDPSQMGSNIYNPNSKLMKVGVPNLEINDILHTIVERKLVKTRMPDSWSDWQIFEYYNPIKHAAYEVIAPAKMPLQSIALKGEVEGTVNFKKSPSKSANEKINYLWEINDVPRIYAEPDMPAFHTVVQRLLVSTNPDWETVSKWYWEMVKPHLESSPEMKQKVAQLTDGIDDKMEKIKAIFKFVSQDIRYLGITVEDTAPGYEPHDSSMTFANRHGVCRDKAALLVAMLREAGFKAYPVLIYSGPKKDEEVPQPYFNHAISAVQNDDGSFILMDSTDESTKELLPEYLNDSSYLVATPQGEGLHTSPIIPAEKNMLTINTEAKIGETGRYTAKSSLTFDGINDNAYRGYFARITPEQRKQYFESLVKRILPGGKLNSLTLLPKNMQDTTQKLQAVMEYEADDILIGGENGKALLSIIEVGSKAGIVNFVLGKAGLEKRRFPLETDYACGVKEDFKIEFSESLGQIVSLPDYTEIDNDQLSWQKHFQVKENLLEGESIFKIKVVSFTPEEYLQLKNNLKQIEYNNRKMAIVDSGSFETAKTKADAIVLDEQIWYNITSENEWQIRKRVRKQIQTYKGKKDNSEIKIDFNPAWEQVELVFAKVETNGEVKEISEQEKNLMDAPWVASAPRYPAAKKLVASLPGVEEGSIIEYEYVIKIKDRPFFAMQQLFGGFDPIESKRVIVKAPAEMNLKITIDQNGAATPDDTALSMIKMEKMLGEDGDNAYMLSASNIPSIKREESLPPLHAILPVVRISTGNWNDYSNQIAELVQRFEMTRERRFAPEKAEEITKALKTETQKIIAIRDFVAKNIRKAGPGFSSLPFSAISKPDITLHDGYGNTTDRALLIKNMLDGIGIKNELVLVSTTSRVESLEQFRLNYPDRKMFNKMLVFATADNKQYYLGDTDQYAELGATPSENYISLLITKTTPDKKILTSKINIATKNLSSKAEQYNITLNSEGKISMEVEEQFKGIYFGSKNKFYSELPPEKKRRHYQEMVAQISQSAKAASDLNTDFTTYPGHIKYSIAAENFAIIDSEYMYVTLPELMGNILGIRGDTRDNDFYQGNYVRYSAQVELALPQDYTNILLAPNATTKLLPNNSGKVELTADTSTQGKIILTYSIDLKPSVIEADNYNQLLEITKWLTDKENRTILLKRTSQN